MGKGKAAAARATVSVEQRKVAGGPRAAGISITSIEAARKAHEAAQPKPRNTAQIRNLQAKYERAVKDRDYWEQRSTAPDRSPTINYDYQLRQSQKEVDSLGKRIRDLQYAPPKPKAPRAEGEPAKRTRTAFASPAERTDALIEMAQGRTYIANGQVRLIERHANYRDSGPIAPWSTAAKREFGSAEKATAYAKDWIKTPAGRLAYGEYAMHHTWDYNAKRNIPRDEKSWSPIERAEVERWRSGDLTPPKLEPKPKGESLEAGLFRTRRDLSRFEVWQRGPGHWDRTSLVRRPVGHFKHYTPSEDAQHNLWMRLHSRTVGALNRVKRDAIQQFDQKQGPAVARHLSAALRGIKPGEPFRLGDAIQAAEAKGAPEWTRLYTAAATPDYARIGGNGRDRQAEIAYAEAFGPEVVPTLHKHEAAALREALVGHDVAIHGEKFNSGFTFHGHVEDVVAGDHNGHMGTPYLVLGAPADNPKGPYFTRPGDPEKMLSTDARDHREINRIDTITVSPKRGAGEAAKMAATLHTENLKNPLYAAFHAGKALNVQRDVSYPVRDQWGISHTEWGRRTVTMRPLGFDGTHFTIEETYKAGGATHTRTQQYTAHDLDARMNNWQSWKITGEARTPKKRKG